MKSMADNQKVYQAIKTIADELCKENKTYLRADLAFELKKYGIASDSSEVSKLVFDAYRYFLPLQLDTLAFGQFESSFHCARLHKPYTIT